MSFNAGDVIRQKQGAVSTDDPQERFVILSHYYATLISGHFGGKPVALQAASLTDGMVWPFEHDEVELVKTRKPKSRRSAHG